MNLIKITKFFILVNYFILFLNLNHSYMYIVYKVNILIHDCGYHLLVYRRRHFSLMVRRTVWLLMSIKWKKIYINMWMSERKIEEREWTARGDRSGEHSKDSPADIFRQLCRCNSLGFVNALTCRVISIRVSLFYILSLTLYVFFYVLHRIFVCIFDYCNGSISFWDYKYLS